MWIITIVLLFPATALGAGQPLIEGNEASLDTADFLSPKSLYTGTALTEGAMSELIAREATNQHELSKERTLVSELSNTAKKLRQRLAGSQKSEQLSRKMADLSKAEAEVIRSSCHQKMDEMQFHFRNRTRILKQRLHNCTSRAQFLLNKTVESSRRELQMERDRSFKAEGRVLVLEEELRRTATALEYTKRKEKGAPLVPEQLEGKHKADAGLKAVLAGLRMQLGNKSVELLRDEPAWSTFVKQLSAVFAAEQKKQPPQVRGMSEVMSEGGATKSMTEHNEDRDQLKEEVENLRAQLRKSQEDTLSVRTELQGTKDQLVSAQLDLQSARGQIESMSNHSDTASDIIALENVSGKALAAERAELSIAEAELARERRNFRAAQQDLNNAHNELAAMNLTRSHLQQKLTAASSEHFARRDGKLLKTKAALHMAIADLNRTRSELEAVRANLAARDANLGLMRAELQRLRGKMAAKEKVLISDNRQVQRLRRQVLDEGHELNSTQTVLSRKLQDLESVNKSLTAERREVIMLKASLANTTRGLQHTRMEMEASIDKLNKTHVDLHGLRVKMAAKDDQLQILHAEERQEENVMNSTRAKLNATEALLNAKLQKLQAYSNSFVARMQELESVHARLRTVTDELNAARADVAARDLKLNMTSEMLHGLRSSLANKTRLQAALDMQLASLRATVQQDASTLHSMQEELLGSRSKLNASQHMVQEKAEALEVANHLFIAKGRQLDQEHAILANVTLALQQLHRNLDSANKTLTAKEQDVNSLSDKLHVTQAQKTRLDEEWKAAEAQDVNLSLALQAKVGDILAAQAELGTVKSQLLSLRNASTRQESVLRERLRAAATDVQSLTMQYKMQEAARHDLLELLSSKGKELNSTRATLAKVESKLAALVTQLGILQQVHVESEVREHNFREVMEHNLTIALGNKDNELSKLHSEMDTTKSKLQGVDAALKQSEQARQFLLAEKRNSSATLDTQNLELDNFRAELAKARHRMSEVDTNALKLNETFETKMLEVEKLRKALAVANEKAAEAAGEVTALKREHSELKVHDAPLETMAAEVDRLRNALAVANDKAAGGERSTTATLEARASEVDRLRAALAAANEKAFEAAEEITALKREGSELKVHGANPQREFDFAMNKKMTFDNSDTLQRATLARDLMQVIERLRVEVRRTHEAGMEADAQHVEQELNVAEAALKDSVEQHAHLDSAVESTLAAMTSALSVRDVQLRTDRSLLEDALANASALQAEVHGLTKALKVEDHALKAAHMLLNTARADVNDLVAAHNAWQSEPVKQLQTEVKKMHNVIQHDEKLIHQYQRRERRLRAKLRFAE